LWFFLIGAIVPIPFYFLARRYPRTFWRYINIPIMLMAANMVPPFNGVNYSSFIFVGIFFQWFMRRRHFRWWLRYNYPLAAGLDAGVIIGLFVIFFSLQLRSNGGINVNWWGNSVWQNTADAQLIPLKTLAKGERFGPSTWA
jgi:OPT oligopeptide transporter protein